MLEADVEIAERRVVAFLNDFVIGTSQDEFHERVIGCTADVGRGAAAIPNGRGSDREFGLPG